MALPSFGVLDSTSLTSYERMVQECKSLGITPLTEQQFAEEDRRIYTDRMRRRAGISDVREPNFGIYR